MKSLPLLSNHPRVRRWTAAVVASVIALGVCLVSYDNVDVYTADYQNMADDKLEQEKSKSAATEDDMFVTEDPYGTNTTSLYVYFTTDDSVSVSYTVMRTATRISPVTPTSNRNTAKPMNSRYSALFPGKRTPSPSR